MLDAELRRHPSAAMGNISSLHDLQAPLEPAGPDPKPHTFLPILNKKLLTQIL